jgi:hypothetical protein
MLHDGAENQQFTVAMPRRVNQVTVHLPDELKLYFLGAHRRTFATIRAAAEEFLLDRRHHIRGALIALRLALRELLLRERLVHEPCRSLSIHLRM